MVSLINLGFSQDYSQMHRRRGKGEAVLCMCMLYMCGCESEREIERGMSRKKREDELIYIGHGPNHYAAIVTVRLGLLLG